MKNILIVYEILLMISGVAQAALITIGGAGNAADTTGYGAVGYTYQISATEVTIAEFTASGAGSGDENYWSSIGPGAPAVNVSWYEAAKYCNWLTSGNIYNGAYQFGSGPLTNVMSRADILADGRLFYLLPTEDEWYKAAYFNVTNGVYSLYANGTATAPTTAQSRYAGSSPWTVGSGLQELNGTYDMMGDVYEWTESANDGMLDDLLGESMILRGGYYGSGALVLSSSSAGIPYPIGDAGEIGGGFRVIAIPEPATALLFGLGGMGAWLLRRNMLKSKEEADA